jgi:phytoene dehydrogenase-like protein
MRPIPDEVDAIFIGAGLNALCAAYLLSVAGWQALVLERHARPGGALQTGEYTLPGFHHDFGAMNLGQFTGSRFFAEHGAALGRKGVTFLRADRSCSSVFPDGDFVGIDTDVAATSRRIAAISPRDAEAWRAWHADFDRVGPTLLGLMAAPAPPLDPLAYRFGVGTVVPAGAEDLVARLLVESLRDTLSARFESEAVRGLIAAWGMHMDFAPDVAGGALMPFLESNIDQRRGIPVARGGSGAVTAALAELISDAGSLVLPDSPVERITVKSGRAAGVRVAGGHEVRCRRAVIASVTPPALIRLLGEDAPPALTAASRRWRFGPGTLVLHLALADLPDWQASPEARRFFYVHVNGTLDQLARSYQQARAGLLPDEPLLVVGQPTAVDPSRAPASRHTLWVMVRAVPARVEGDALGRIPPGPWADIKEAYAERQIETIERHAPGFEARILGRRVFSPDDLEAVNANLVGGDLLAGSHHLPQWWSRRPGADWAHAIPALHLTGAASWPGAGANPTSGTLLADALLGGER